MVAWPASNVDLALVEGHLTTPRVLGPEYVVSVLHGYIMALRISSVSSRHALYLPHVNAFTAYLSVSSFLVVHCEEPSTAYIAPREDLQIDDLEPPTRSVLAKPALTTCPCIRLSHQASPLEDASG
ncbi:hypothetical protein VTO73DRAFT_12152 [Trametes versicolor]